MSGYTKKENEYSKKSWAANLTGGFLTGFSKAGFLKIVKTGLSKPPLKLTMSKAGKTINLAGQAISLGSLYYDAQAIKNSNNKSRAVINSLGRGFAGGIAGGSIGGVSAGALRFGFLPKARGFIKTKMANETARFYKATPVNKAAGLGQMIKDRAIRFIRVRGRIVPIRGKTTRVGPALLAAPKGS